MSLWRQIVTECAGVGHRFIEYLRWAVPCPCNFLDRESALHSRFVSIEWDLFEN